MANPVYPESSIIASASTWATVNTVLPKNKTGVEKGDPPRIKIGDGVTPWNDLPYAVQSGIDGADGRGIVSVIKTDTSELVDTYTITYTDETTTTFTVTNGSSAVGGDGTALQEHIDSETPHPVYDDGPSLTLLYTNAKV